MLLKKSLGISALILCALLGVLTGLGGYTFYYAKGASYLSNDPKSCVNCHIMREHYDGWQKASHHAVATCNDCHVPQETVPKYLAKLDNGFWHSKGFTFQDFHEPIRIRARNLRLLQENCIRCHATTVSEMMITYGPDVTTMNCMHCHSSVGHGPQK